MAVGVFFARRGNFARILASRNPQVDLMEQLTDRRSPCHALPDDENPPSELEELFDRCLIPSYVFVNLLLPEVGVRLGKPKICASFMPVPEATIDEDHGPMLRQNDIRAAREIAPMQPEPEASSMQATAHYKFWLRVPRADSGHHLGSAQGFLLSQTSWPLVEARQC